MPRFISTANPSEQAHGGVPHVPHPLEIPQFHAFHHPHMAPHVVPPPPPPPAHARVGMPLLEFDERDVEIFKAAFQDEDTAIAATEIVYNAPLEIQVEVFQTLMMIENLLLAADQEAACLPNGVIGSSKTIVSMTTKRNYARWANPVLDDNAESLFMRIYGENGKEIVGILQGAPYEIGVVSTLLAYLAHLHDLLIDSIGKQKNDKE